VLFLSTQVWFVNYHVNVFDASICPSRHLLSNFARLTPRQFLDIVGILVLGIASVRIGRLYECCGGLDRPRRCRCRYLKILPEFSARGVRLTHLAPPAGVRQQLEEHFGPKFGSNVGSAQDRPELVPVGGIIITLTETSTASCCLSFLPLTKYELSSPSTIAPYTQVTAPCLRGPSTRK